MRRHSYLPAVALLAFLAFVAWWFWPKRQPLPAGLDPLISDLPHVAAIEGDAGGRPERIALWR